MSKKKEKILKWVICTLITLFFAAIGWIVAASWNASGIVSDVRANTVAADENKETIKEVKREVTLKIDANSTAINETKTDAVGLKKDIERLDEKMDDLNLSQTKLRTEQQAAFQEILKRLPEND